MKKDKCQIRELKKELKQRLSQIERLNDLQIENSTEIKRLRSVLNESIKFKEFFEDLKVLLGSVK